MKRSETSGSAEHLLILSGLKVAKRKPRHGGMVAVRDEKYCKEALTAFGGVLRYQQRKL